MVTKSFRTNDYIVEASYYNGKKEATYVDIYNQNATMVASFSVTTDENDGKNAILQVSKMFDDVDLQRLSLEIAESAAYVKGNKKVTYQANGFEKIRFCEFLDNQGYEFDGENFVKDSLLSSEYFYQFYGFIPTPDEM